MERHIFADRSLLGISEMISWRHGDRNIHSSWFLDADISRLMKAIHSPSQNSNAHNATALVYALTHSIPFQLSSAARISGP